MKPVAIDLFCGNCGAPLGDCRTDKKFCSSRCYQRFKKGRPSFPYERPCRACGTGFTVASRPDANRQYCSSKCSKSASVKGTDVWLKLHPEKMKEYNATRLSKNPDYWREKGRVERKRILELLGEKCVVCGVDNPNWLHVDYIPTTRNERFRHPRTLKFVTANPELFRILCANHHYELTMTGRIDGTDITQ